MTPTGETSVPVSPATERFRGSRWLWVRSPLATFKKQVLRLTADLLNQNQLRVDRGMNMF